jgi:hypothetical protein
MKRINENFVFYTTWNKLAEAVQNHLPDNYVGLEEMEQDKPVRLVPIWNDDGEIIPDWLEVEVGEYWGSSLRYDTTMFDAEGNPTSIHDWLPEEYHDKVYPREGIAVHTDVLQYLPEED